MNNTTRNKTTARLSVMNGFPFPNKQSEGDSSSVVVDKAFEHSEFNHSSPPSPFSLWSMASAMELSRAPKNDEDQSWDPHFFTNDPTALTVSPTVPAYFAVQQDSQPVDPNIAPWLSEQFNDVIPEYVGPQFHPAHASLQLTRPTQALPPSHSKGAIFKNSSFSLIKPKLHQHASKARLGRTSESNIDAGSSISIPSDDNSKMSFFKALKRKVSQPRMKDPPLSGTTS